MQTPTLAQLRKACWPLHQRLEKRLDVPRRFGSPGPYREHLEKMWGFCAALEPHIARSALGEALPDYESRRKLPVLTRDLHALGLATETLQRVPRCEDVPMRTWPRRSAASTYSKVQRLAARFCFPW